ncbi:MAG: hypothetical protein J6G98_05245 [Bacilli bacterium]|nr:hypothetical protein [Bacilli bacterium]
MNETKDFFSESEKRKILDEPFNNLNSVMLDIFSEKVKSQKEITLLKNYENKHSLFEISKIDPRIYNEISNIFFDSVNDDYECIELSPICPIGLSSIISGTNQNNVLSALRGAEVVSDSSISMALECAKRIKNEKKSCINLASSTRLLRTQNYGQGVKKHWSQHFKACSLVSSFRNEKSNMFDTLNYQLSNWIKVLNNLKNNLEIEKININVCFLPLVKEIYKEYEISEKELLSNSMNEDYHIFNKYNINLPASLENLDLIAGLSENKDYLLSIRNVFKYIDDNIFIPLKSNYPNINFGLQLERKSGLNYYDNFCYEIIVEFKNGKYLNLVDGGITNWTGKILSDSKEKCITSGMGLEYLGKIYKR